MAEHIEHGRLRMALGRHRLITGHGEPGLESFSSTSARVPAIVPDHLETFVRNMVSDGGDEFLGGSPWHSDKAE